MTVETRPAPLKTIWYMGSKARILDFVTAPIRERVAPGGTVLDLMSGTSAVGLALKDDYRVIAADVQEYARALAAGLLTDREFPDPAWLAEGAFWAAYNLNRSHLEVWFEAALADEAQLLADQSTLGAAAYGRFCRRTPYLGGAGRTESIDPAFRRVQAFYDEPLRDKLRQGRGPACLVSLYFMNAYFGVRQCIAIDSLRYAIARHPDPRARPLLMVALLTAASTATSGTNHFAQFRKAGEDDGALRARRRQDLRESFVDRFGELAQQLAPAPHANRALRGDFRAVLAREDLGAVDVVYLDPPYSNANFSRFYHVLETICRYDYPAATGVGRYRDDRHASPFCRKAECAQAFADALAGAVRRGAQMVVSYADSPTAVLSRAELESLCKRYYRDVEAREQALAHSKQGRSTALEVREIVLACRDERRAALA